MRAMPIVGKKNLRALARVHEHFDDDGSSEIVNSIRHESEGEGDERLLSCGIFISTTSRLIQETWEQSVVAVSLSIV